MVRDIAVPIASDVDIVSAREQGRALAERIGFSQVERTVIATAISEIARNIVEHAKKGNMVLSPCQHGSRVGIQIIATDEGPGIPDVSRAMQDEYSTGKGLGLGLPGSKRLMDEFEVQSNVGKGTVVTMRKWLPL
ncbi:MAG TPA: anti-sigma regulatory factor [bacterium]|nr:anti-sigma regulatory factor [bacterium]